MDKKTARRLKKEARATPYTNKGLAAIGAVVFFIYGVVLLSWYFEPGKIYDFGFWLVSTCAVFILAFYCAHRYKKYCDAEKI